MPGPIHDGLLALLTQFPTLHRCRAWTMVLSHDADVRRQARELFEDEPELCPLIVEPDLIPPIVNFSEARRRPDVAILSAVMHAQSELGVACARAAHVALDELPKEFRQCYLNLLNACLTEEQKLETQQSLPSPIQRLPDEIESELCPMERASYWYQLELRKLQEREVGRQESRQAVLATLWDTLTQRNIDLDPDSRARLEQCNDVGLLLRILVRAAPRQTWLDLQTISR
jgi:hypothetical protein